MRQLKCHVITGVLLYAVMFLSSCTFLEEVHGTLFVPSIRASEVDRLVAEADSGNVRAKRAILRYGRKLVPQETRDRYHNEMIELGEWEYLGFFKYMGVKPKEPTLTANPTAKSEFRWEEYGVEKGNTDCMYSLGVKYNLERSYNPERSELLLRQAADSLHAFARRELREREGSITVFDRGVFCFSQIWNRDMADESLLCRFSNATFHASYGFMVECFAQLLTHIWWQCLLFLAFMIIAFVVATLWATTLRKTTRHAVVTSAVYGMFNGYAWYYMGHACESYGMLKTYNSIGHYTYQEGAFGWVSDACIYLTWIWTALMLLLFGYLVPASSGGGNGGSTYNGWKDHNRAMKDFEAQRERSRMKEINKNLWGH